MDQVTNRRQAQLDRDLAVSINMHPKVVRKSIRLAFLAPEITEALILGYQPKSLTLTDLQLATSLSWRAKILAWASVSGAICKDSIVK